MPGREQPTLCRATQTLQQDRGGLKHTKHQNSICSTVWATRGQTANRQPGRSFWSKGMGACLRVRALGTGEKEGEAEAVSIY